MNISQIGINLIKKFEGCYLHSYYDCVGVLTIGYGTTLADLPTLYDGMEITQEEADNLLRRHIRRYESDVMECINTGYIPFTVSQSMFDALVSFHYNTGSVRTLCQNHRDKDTVARKMLEYTHGQNGIVYAGLVRRRQAEHDLFVAEDVEVITPTLPKRRGKIYELQEELNRQGFKDMNGNELLEDGVFGECTLSACPTVRMGASGGLTRWIQLRLFNPSECDGIFGIATHQAVQLFQKNHGLVADGIVGANTWRALCE